MSTLGERLEGLIAKWREQAKLVAPFMVATTWNVCADELAAALVAEGQGDGRCNYYFGGFDGGNRCQKPMGHDASCGHEWRLASEPAAAAPSLHKEGKEGSGASIGDLLPCGHTRDNWHEGYLSTSKPGESHGPKTHAHCRACAALHKEGAGGAPAERLREALEAIQWGGCDGLVPVCPKCFGDQEQGHAEDCIVGRALAASPAGRAEQERKP